MKRCDEAEVMRLLLLCNCIDVSEIIAWADGEIGNEENPPYPLIELSLLGNSNPLDVESKLHELALDTEPFGAIRTALGEIWRKIDEGRKVDLEALTIALESIPPNHNWELPKDLMILNGISDFTYLEIVYGKTEKEAEKSFLNELKKFYSEPVGSHNEHKRSS